MENLSTLKDLLQQIDQRKADVDGLRPLTQEQEGRIMQKFRLDWNYHSNAIEGNSLTYGETIAFIMEGLTAKGKPFKDHLDIKGHNEGIDYLMHFIQNHEQLSEKVIRELHEMILVEAYSNPAQTTDGQQVAKRVTLGAYKTMSNHVKTPTGEIHYYATPEETPAKMTNLIDWLRKHQQKQDLHPLVLAASFHHRFVAIHPFDDGNGRMSRLLMNLLLMQYGYPPVVIKQQDRQAYYYALRQADARDLDAFLEYIGENLLYSLEIQLKGARGESMEEPDDLDKEIALLKGSLGGIKEIQEGNGHVLAETFGTILWPFFLDLKGTCSKLNDLFFTHESEVTIHNLWNRPLSLPEDISPEDLIANVKKFKDFENFYDKNLIEFEFIYRWKNFKKAETPFDINRKIEMKFDRFFFTVEFGVIPYKLRFQKNYNTPFTTIEKKSLIDAFIKSSLEQIKVNTGK